MLGESAGITVTSEIPAAPIAMAVDRHRIREMLLNLVTNAIKYTPPGGTVALGLAQEDGSVVFTVARHRDRHRAGRPAAHLRPVLAGRPGPVPHRRSAGTGLGLAITKWIAEAHGGLHHGAEPAGAGLGRSPSACPKRAGSHVSGRARVGDAPSCNIPPDRRLDR